jgi:hypothetical protein
LDVIVGLIIGLIAGLIAGISVTLYFILKKPYLIVERMDMEDIMKFAGVVQDGTQGETQESS